MTTVSSVEGPGDTRHVCVSFPVFPTSHVLVRNIAYAQIDCQAAASLPRRHGPTLHAYIRRDTRKEEKKKAPSGKIWSLQKGSCLVIPPLGDWFRAGRQKRSTEQLFTESFGGLYQAAQNTGQVRNRQTQVPQETNPVDRTSAKSTSETIRLGRVTAVPQTSHAYSRHQIRQQTCSAVLVLR